MQRTYWHKQTTDKPLYPEIIWSKPEVKAQSGKLAIIGGNLQSFTAPAEAFSAAERSGVGLTRVLLPLPVKKLTGQLFETLEFGAGNPSGSFSQQALSAWLDMAAWADGTLLAGDLGKNSETAIVFEKFLQEYSGMLTLANDAVDYALLSPSVFLKRPSTALVVPIRQLQKIGSQAKLSTPFTQNMDLLHLIDGLHSLTDQSPLTIITKVHDQLCIASSGEVSTTPAGAGNSWATPTAAAIAVWWLQNPAKPLESMTAAMFEAMPKD